MAPDTTIHIDQALPSIIALRHELHQHPEIRYQEHWTSARIQHFLAPLGLTISPGHAGGTGLIATLDGAKGEGPTLALRADIDALEIHEENTFPYASTIPGRMHACGHDGHTACLCGAAALLAKHRNAFPGRIKFIFQPAEEQGGGGRRIVEEGLLDDADAVFALHGWPQLPLGNIAIAPSLMMASADFFQITIHGHGGHGADPAATIDPILIAAQIINNLQALISRETNPWEAAVLTIAKIEAGSTFNIIPDTATLQGAFRALTPERRNALTQGITRIATHTAQAFRANATVDIPKENSYPPLINTPAMSAFLQTCAQRCLGPQNVTEIPHPYMVSEDFACYLQKIPGAFCLLGLAENTPHPPLHTATFDFNDHALPIALRLLTELALSFLNHPPRL